MTWCTNDQNTQFLYELEFYLTVLFPVSILEDFAKFSQNWKIDFFNSFWSLTTLCALNPLNASVALIKKKPVNWLASKSIDWFLHERNTGI